MSSRSSTPEEAQSSVENAGVAAISVAVASEAVQLEVRTIEDAAIDQHALSANDDEEDPSPPRVVPEELSERLLEEDFATVEEMHQGMVEGFHKHTKNHMLTNVAQQQVMDLDRERDFATEEIQTFDDLYDHVGQKAFNAGYMKAMKDAAELQKYLALRAGRRADEMNGWGEMEGWKEVVEEVEKDQEMGTDEEEEYGDESEPDVQLEVVDDENKERVVDEEAAEDNDEDLYSANNPPSKKREECEVSDEEPVAISRRSKKAKTSSAFTALGDSDSDEEEQVVPAKPARQIRANTKTKKSRLFPSHNRNEDPQAKDARMFFLAQAKAEPSKVDQPIVPRRAGVNERKHPSKIRGDWGTPRVRAVSKVQFQAIRKHGKYTTSAYENKGPGYTYNLPLTHREARRYENMPISNGYTYFFERGDYSEEDPMLDGRMINFELGHFQAIRQVKNLRRERLAAGENQDNESSLSDDDSQYDSDRATCGWDFVQRRAMYEAKAKARASRQGKENSSAIAPEAPSGDNDRFADEDERETDADDESDEVDEEEQVGEEDDAEEVLQAREDTPESQQSEEV